MAQAGFCSGGASHWRRKSSIFSYFAQGSFRCHSSISGLIQQDMTSNNLHHSASNSWNWYEAPSKNLRFVSGGHGLLSLILAALLIPRWFCYEEGQEKTFLIVYCALFSLTRFDDCNFLFLTRISIMTAWEKFKPHILWRDGFVAFDSLQSEKVTNTRIVIPAVATIWVVLLDVFFSCVWDF